MKEEKEKQNVSVIAKLYTKANRFKEDCETTFIPGVFPPQVRNVCETGGELLYLLKKFAPIIWEVYFKDFVKLEFPDDFEEQWEDRNWSNILQLWGHTLDIESNLIDGGDLDNFFRQKLASLTKGAGYVLQKYEDVEWLTITKDWLEWFYDRTFHILDRLIDSLGNFLKGVDVNENPTARLALIEQFLLETEYDFFRDAQAIGPYMPSEDYPPSMWNNGEVDIDLGLHPGTLRAQIIGGRKIQCSFSPDGKNSTSIEWILTGGEEVRSYGRYSYKREIFETWNYTTGKFLGRWQTDKRAYWFIEDANVYESYAEHNIMLSLPLFKNRDYEQLAKNIVKVVKNNQPEWWPGEVQWSYIADLDRIIHECRLAREIYQEKEQMLSSVSIGLSKVPKPPPQIPAEFKSPPMSLKELAACFGQDTTVAKINTMIRMGAIRAERIHRQSYYFDLRSLPAYVREGIKSRAKI